MSGSTLGGIVGGVIGFYVGGPTGAQWGWMIGSAVGGYVDPTVIKGPQLTDPQQQTASEGAPIPLIYGTYAVIGTIIQCQSEPTEHKHKESGKGGPVQETYTYTRTVAMLICRAAPLGGEMLLRRAWVNGKLAYDATGSGKLDADSAKFLAGMTFYSGSETQMPDADLEALPVGDGGGVGNVPAYRGSCYAVLPNCDVTQSGGAVPIIKWEVVSSGTQTSSIPNPNWIATDGLGNFQTSNGTDWLTNEAFSASATGKFMRYNNGVLLLSTNSSCKYSTNRGVTWSDTSIPSGEHATSDYRTNVFDNEFWLLAQTSGKILHGNGGSLDTITLSLPHESPVSIAGAAGFQVLGCSHNEARIPVEVSTDHFVTHASQDIDVLDDVVLAVSNGSRILVGGEDSLLTQYTDDGLSWSDAYTMPSELGAKLIGGDAHENIFVVFGSDGLAVSTNGGASFTAITLSEEFHPYDVQIGGGLIVAVGEKNSGAGTGRIWTAPLSNPFAWTKRDHNFGSSAIKAVAFMACAGYAIPDAPGWYIHDDGTLCGSEANAVSPDTIDLESIVGDLTERGGVTDYDVTALDGIPVLGFAITQPTTAGACIDELRKVFFFDMPEWGNSGETYVKLRAWLRGGSSVLNLTDDDLVDVDDDDDTRRQAVEFPRKVNFIAPDPDHDYEPITQSAERESENVKSTSEITVSTSVASTRDMAAPIADKLLRIACEEAQGQITRTVPEEFTQFTTSDIVTYGGRRYRIDKIDAQDGQSQWTMTRDRASAYESNATGSVGVAVPDPVSTLRGPTLFWAGNLPRLNSPDVGPGLYIGVCGLMAGWQGCDLYMSVDGGTTETKVATIIDPATMGFLTADLDSGDTLSVQLYNDDELDDATDDQIALRFNACAVTTAGESEILQFKDTTDTGTKTYDLTTLYRGGLATDVASHDTNDPFVVLDNSILFLPLDISLAWRDLIFRPVTRGTVPANNETYTVHFDPKFTGAAVYDAYVDDAGNAYVDDTGATYYTEVT